MSLRNKIIWLFVGLAVIPMLTLATFSYGFSRKLVERTVQSTLSESARLVQSSIRSARDQKETTVDRAAASGPIQRAVAGRGMEAEIVAQLSYVHNQFEYIQVQDRTGTVIAGLGIVPSDSIQCRNGDASRLLRVRRPVSGTGTVLEAGYWAADLVNGDGIGLSNSVLVVDSPSKSVLFRQGCREGLDQTAPWVPRVLTALDRAGPGGGMLSVSAGEEDLLAAHLSLPEIEWAVVVVASPTPVLLPLGRLHLYYWLFVLVLTVSTVMAFSMLTGPVTRSLAELTRAAEEIGAGELNPWLPPPGSGEVGQLTVAVSRMANRLREMMIQVERNGRLAVVGKLSAYLAHEIRNPLSSVKMNLQRLQRWVNRGELPPIAAEPVEISLKEVDRLAAAVTGVLQLSRAQDGAFEPVSLHQVLLEAQSLLQEKFRAQSVELDLALDAGADRVMARPGQLKSAVLNLMVNALEAQPDGGLLEVHTDLTRPGEEEGPWIELRFEDRGPGVPDAFRDEIFDPFFTTKNTGSGIGLAIALQNVKENGGNLRLEESDPKTTTGAAFVMAFPLAPVSTSGSVRTEKDFDSDWANRLSSWRSRRDGWKRRAQETRRAGSSPERSSDASAPGTEDEGSPGSSDLWKGIN